MNEQKPGWLYANKDNPAGEEYAIHIETGWVFFKDEKGRITKYSPEEMKILNSGVSPENKKALAQVHRIKKIFEGEIVKYGSNETEKGKQGENGGGGNSNTVNQSTGGQVVSNTGNGAENGIGELDLF